ncbi:hypothetical protein ABAC402_00350 [Asticcacaulis sp. AC402]|nr:hypothetical protein ABAC402_00350 [Asticcacaulis sp. AC402]
MYFGKWRFAGKLFCCDAVICQIVEKIFQIFFAFLAALGLYGVNAPVWGCAGVSLTMAKAIAIAKNRTQELTALAVSFVVAVIVFDLVSLLIGGVLSPLSSEW